MTRSIAACLRNTSCAAVIALGLVLWLGACQQRPETMTQSGVPASSGVGSAGAAGSAGTAGAAGSGVGSAGAGSAVAPAAAGVGSAAGGPTEFGPGGLVRYAAKTATTDFFSVNQDEQAFFIATWDSTGAAATKR